MSATTSPHALGSPGGVPAGSAAPAPGDPARSWPPVSVVLATRNRPELLRRAVRAVVEQDYPGDIRCVVVFDQEQPDLSLVSAAPTRPVAVTTNSRRAGLAGARNSGILAADGDLVAFCDDDDEWLPGKLRRQVEELHRQPDACLVAGGIRVCYDGVSVERCLEARTVTLADLLRSRLSQLHPSTFVIRRAALLDPLGLVSEDVPGSYAEDYEFLLRAARLGPVANVPEVCTQVLWHAQSYFDSRWETISTALQWLLQRYPEFGQQPRGEARVTGQIAFAEAARRHRREALRWSARTLRRNVREPRGYLALLVAAGVLRADTVLRALHLRGRGI